VHKCILWGFCGFASHSIGVDTEFNGPNYCRDFAHFCPDRLP